MLLRWLAIAAFAVWAARRKSLTIWILVAMVIGAEVGHDFPDAAVSLRVLSQIFLRLIRTIVAPLLFATLVVGIAGHSNLRQVGRMGVKALIYFEVVTTLALLIGWGAITLSRAGVGVALGPPPDATQIPQAVARTWQDIVLEIFPENFAKSVVDGQMLQIVVFSVIFGIALALLPEDKKRPMLAFADSLAETMFRFTRIVMLMAPLGVGAAIAYTVGRLGIGVLGNLLMLLVTFYAAVAVFVVAVLLPVALIANVPLRGSGRRAGVDRVCDDELGGRAPARHAGDGTDWGAASDRRVCDPDGIQLQPRRQHALSLAGCNLRCAGCRHSDAVWTTVPPARHADALE